MTNQEVQMYNPVMSTGGYIFLCSNDTEQECLDRLLLGGKPPYKNRTSTIKPGDKLFLYNYQSGRLHGVFKATSIPQMNIVEEAWSSKYPWQVKVDWLTRYKPLTLTDFELIMPLNNKGMPDSFISPEKLVDIEKLFESDQRLTPVEVEYRDRNSPKYFTDDGHKVRSLAERKIDNWLYRNGYLHAYEVHIAENHPEYCDFYLPLDNGDGVYIEYWGKEDAQYLERKKDKLELYKKYNLKLIELEKNDPNNLDKILNPKIKV